MRRLTILLLMQFAMAAQAGVPFTLTSSAFKEDGTLAKDQLNAMPRCGSGGDVSPSLSWTSPPAGSKAFAVTSFDPDARAGKGWWHWALFDLPADTHALPENAGKVGSPPDGATDAKNSFGVVGYGGACPPPGDKPHHYVFTVWAVGEAKLPFDAGSTAEEVGKWLAAHAIGKAEITARYGR